MPVSLYTTADQSHTLYNHELDETYHSRNGAVDESLHVFLANGFLAKAEHQRKIRLLEAGFGTGLNAILTLHEAQKQQVSCQYVSLETYPLPASLINQLNYTEFIPKQLHATYYAMHQAGWNKEVKLDAHFLLTKVQQSIHDYQPDQGFDLVYFDAFGPDKQPDMWTPEVFASFYEWMNTGGVFVTYSAKGDVRRALIRAGFQVERLPGGNRKRHMLRAIKP